MKKMKMSSQPSYGGSDCLISSTDGQMPSEVMMKEYPMVDIGESAEYKGSLKETDEQMMADHRKKNSQKTSRQV